ncbi:hypothetical protein KP509_20G042500 [Ceratopteris richardii]|uniref:Reverse transcriptase domain-containing protein n=1 Tax=Ceratopteris richardii TaxID=49495 RepID=A0A8T2SGI2_CERRI|nr:hypothetical protein KP509_20G042500 [Ceratopteris richardii]
MHEYPLAPLLFAIFLLIRDHHSKGKISGIKIPNYQDELFLQNYVDPNLVVHNDPQSIECFWEVLDTSYLASGSKVNLSKTMKKTINNETPCFLLNKVNLFTMGKTFRLLRILVGFKISPKMNGMGSCKSLRRIAIGNLRGIT